MAADGIDFECKIIMLKNDYNVTTSIWLVGIVLTFEVFPGFGW